MVHFSRRAQKYVWGGMGFTYTEDPLFLTMFLDTEIGKKYGSGPTKTNVV